MMSLQEGLQVDMNIDLSARGILESMEYRRTNARFSEGKYYCLTESGGRDEDRIEQATIFPAKDRCNTPVKLRAKSE